MLSSIHLLTHRMYLHRIIESIIVVVIIGYLSLCFNRANSLIHWLLFGTTFSLVVVLSDFSVVLLD